MHLLIIGGTRPARMAEAEARTRAHGGPPEHELSARDLPFTRIEQLGLPEGPRLIRLDDIEVAFPNRQTNGIRLVLTQSTYLVQALVDRLDPGALIIATAEAAALERCAPEALAGRGVWRRFERLTVPAAPEGIADAPANGASGPLLQRAFTSASPKERVTLCREAARLSPDSEISALSLASACRELGDRDGARAALDSSMRLAPDWAAAHFEDGKFWLSVEDLERARDAFARAGELMPTFSAAFSNLGAALGELDDADGAARAFASALTHDPDNYTILNNIGVLNRERGRLDESETALRRVIQLAPEFVFGHYNLGHTRFLKGEYAAALQAYEEGRRRDPEKNRRQGCRLALVRFATGDRAGAERELWPLIGAAPPEEREDLLLEAYEIGCALLQAQPALAAERGFIEQIAASMTA